MKILPKKTESGTAILEATIVVMIIALIFVAFVRMGVAALQEQRLQSELSSRAWSKAAGAPAAYEKHKVKPELLGWRAEKAKTEKRSLRVDLANDW